MKRQKGKAHRGFSRKAALLLFIIGIIAVVTAFGIYQQLNQGKKSSAEYFRISDVAAVGKFKSNSVLITAIGFNLTAVGGDANNVCIKIDGLKPAPGSPTLVGPGVEDVVHFEHLKKGESHPIEFGGISPDQGHRSVETANGLYPVEVNIRCDEAEGKITIYLSKDEIMPL